MKKSSAKDLTVGSPMKLLLSFMIPLMLGMLFQQFYNMVDVMIVGRFLGVDALAGVGSTGSINFMLTGGCMGICAGFAIPVAQAFGRHDETGRYHCRSDGGIHRHHVPPDSDLDEESCRYF